MAPGRVDLRRLGLGLEYATIGWLVVVVAGAVAYSEALVGWGDFGFHVFGASVAIWQLRRPGRDEEQRSVRLIALSFFGLAAYVTADAVHELAGGGRTPAALATPALAYLIAMLVLGLAKRRVGRDLGSRTLVIDSTGTLLCAGLSGALLAQLALAATLGWWQVGPLASAVIAWLAVSKGRAAWANTGGPVLVPSGARVGLLPASSEPSGAPPGALCGHAGTRRVVPPGPE